ncbi:MAG: glycoside hydrolase family 32 protein [Geodermatophilaceae bacterium]|nr:glycoside hydrolase family 32 protein [Geodermatophilaceae bacterium]
MNDPYGVTWHDGRYQLFFQYNPEAAQWSARMCWGQADSPDLLRWSEPAVALAPTGSGGDGCWSGAVVMAGDRPRMLYTSVRSEDWDRGRIAQAQGNASFDRWVPDPAAAVLGPPAGLGLTHFRDPYVWWAGGGWHMAVGAGLDTGAGAVLGYASPDLHDWQFTGVICSRLSTVTEPVWTGSVWECPQLFELEGRWVLIVSAGHEGVTRHVAYAVGDYDGSTFMPLRWHRLLYGDSLYATTTFLDADGRRCALSWCREEGPVVGRDWAGALSVPHVLRRTGDRVIAAPHPDVDGLRTAISVQTGPVRLGPAPLRLSPVGPQSDVVLSGGLNSADRLDLTLLQGTRVVLTLALAGDNLTLRRPDRADEQMPLGVAPDGGFELRLLLDASVAEVFTPGGMASVRIMPAMGTGELALTARQGHAELDQLTVHELAL